MKTINSCFVNIKWFLLVLLVSIIFLLVSPMQVYAASATIRFEQEEPITAVGEEIKINLLVDTDTYLGDFEGFLFYDASILEYVSGPSCITGGDGTLKVNDKGASPTWDTRKYVLTFRTLKTGTCEIGMKDEIFAYGSEDGLEMSVSSSILTLFVQAAETASSNAALTVLKISPGSLTPSFDKDILEYQTFVEADIDQLIVSALAEEVSAKVSIKDNKNLKPGNNMVSITVTAENGKERVYKITVVKEEQKGSVTEPPVEKRQDWRFESYRENGTTYLLGQYLYTVSEDKKGITIPEGYEKTQIVVDGNSISAYGKDNNPEQDFLLLILKNEEGEAGLYRYDRIEKTIQRYTEEKIVIQNTTGRSEAEVAKIKKDFQDNLAKMGFVVAGLCGLCAILLIGLIRFYLKSKGIKDDEID